MRMTFPHPDRLVTIAADNLTRSFTVGRQTHPAVRGVSIEATSGKAIGIVGESGSGKSTLARILAGLDRPTSGGLDYNGVPLRRLLSTPSERLHVRRNIQMVSQDTTSSFDPRRTLREAVRAPAIRLRAMSRDEADHAVDVVLGTLHIPAAMADRKPNQVSGGQRQRFALARALIVEPRLLVCDEVVSALDVSVQGGVLNLLKECVTEQGVGMVFVSHGLPATAFLCDEIAVMFMGEIVEHGPTEQIVADPRHEYTRHLLASSVGRVGVEAAS